MQDNWNLRKEDKQNWLVFGGSVFGAFILSIVVILLDTRTIPLLDNVPNWLLTDVELAKEVLSALVSTLFAVATFTFSAMLTTVALYTANFSPRIVENFFLNKVALRTLGIFLGGFVYSLSSLAFMRRSSGDTMVISGTIAWMYATAAVVYFIKFIFQTSNYVQMEKTVSKIYSEAEQVFDKNISYFKKYPKLEHIPEIDTLYQYKVEANEDADAYIDYIRFEELKDICEQYQAVCVTQVRMGTFLNKGQPIAIFYTNQKIADENQLADQVNQTMSYNAERSAVFDPYYSRNKLTDIALRAVSPALNDPHTAIHVLHYKSLLELKFAELSGRHAIVGDMKEEQGIHDPTLKYMGCILYEYNDFSADLHRGYWQLVHYMKEDISCVNAIFDALLVIAYGAHEEKLGYIKEYSQYVYDSTQEYFPLKFNRQIIEEKHQTIMAVDTVKD